MEKTAENKVVAFFDRTMDAIVWMTSGTIILIMLFIVYDVFQRYSMGWQTRWISDFIALYLIIYLSMLPAAWILMKGGHVSIDLFLSLLGKKQRDYVTLSTHILGLLYSVVLTWQGALYTWREVIYKTSFPTTSWLPVWPAVIAIFIGGVLLCSGFAMKIVAQIWFPNHNISSGERFD
ncbi:MAG: TRAP transporter small permease subunit [Thermodesulfobacteriota bacterium]